MYTATYSPDDNKLRLYAATRLDPETYARVKAAGFRWAPKQDLFVAPMWTQCWETDEIPSDDFTEAVRALLARAERADPMSAVTYAEGCPAYSVRSVVHRGGGHWENAEVGHFPTRKEARAFAEHYANVEGRACYVYRLKDVETFWAGDNRAHALGVNS